MPAPRLSTGRVPAGPPAPSTASAGLRRPHRLFSPRLRGGRSCRGLASHQWLLLIGAVAGMGALAIFVLSTTVDDAVDRAGADDPARLASARRAARLVESEAVTITPETWPLDTWGQWEMYFRARCRNIETAYREHGIKVQRGTNPDEDPSDPDDDLIVPIIRPGAPNSDRADLIIDRSTDPPDLASSANAALPKDSDEFRKPATTVKAQVLCRLVE